ncbi:MAG: rod-binding protein [Lachnospiraceae bacterium]|nr:rod-binding protein [Lachnospiraceae bacterium]
MEINNDYTMNSVMSRLNASGSGNSRASNIEGALKSLDKNASDEELMEACKSFEAYFVSQVMSRVKDAVAPSSEKENQYMTLFKDKLYEAYADDIAQNGELGLAQQLYDAMKRDYGNGRK